MPFGASTAALEEPDPDDEEDDDTYTGLAEKGIATCDSLRISYKDPKYGQLLSEDVFLDARDSLLGGGSFILASAADISALQAQSDKAKHHIHNTKATTDACRRDYLREHQYLLDELRRLEKTAASFGPKSVAKEIREVMEKTSTDMAVVAQDVTALLTNDEVGDLVEAAGTREEEDEELVHYLQKANVNVEDELQTRLVLKRMRNDTEAIRIERERVRKVIEAIEGNPEDGAEKGVEKLVAALITAAEGDDIGIQELIDQVLAKAPTEDDRQVIEDKLTNDLKTRYLELADRKNEITPKVEAWRKLLAEREARLAKMESLGEKVEEAEERLRLKLENQKKLKNEPPKEYKVPFWDIESLMTPEQRARLKEEENAVRQKEMEAKRLGLKLENLQSEIETSEAATGDVTSKYKNAEMSVATAEQDVVKAEQRVTDAETAVADAQNEAKEVKRKKEQLEDECTAALAPKPKVTDLRKVEKECEEARLKNTELKAEEVRLWAKEKEYERRYDKTELAWLAKKEEQAAAALNAELAAAEAAGTLPTDTSTRKRPSDPMLLDYSERVVLPEYAQASRSNALHTDARARERRLRKAQREAADQLALDLLARAQKMATESGAVQGSSSVPLNFRRPEDLKVKSAHAQQSVESVADTIQALRVSGAQFADDLRRLGKQFATAVTESCSIHTDIPKRLADVLSNGVQACSMRDELMRALDHHQSCMSRAKDCWRYVELGCERGAKETELESEQESCAVCEDDLTTAARNLYSTAAQASADGPSSVVQHAKQCCQDWEAAEPRLVAATAMRGMLWPQVLAVSAQLVFERAAQDKLENLLKVEARRKTITDAEIYAPPAAKRALAAMRMAKGHSMHRVILPEPSPASPPQQVSFLE